MFAKYLLEGFNSIVHAVKYKRSEFKDLAISGCRSSAHTTQRLAFSHATSLAKAATQKTIKPAVITVGDELVLGEREHNNNEKWMIKMLTSRGAAPRLCTQVGDRVDDIASIIAFLKKSDYWPIFVSGGLGGTHDDKTREGVATSLNVPCERNEECWNILDIKYKNLPAGFNEQRQRMSSLPRGCTLIRNPVGAPGFSIDGIYAYPGFPRMLHPMMEETVNSLFPDIVDFTTLDVHLETVEAAIAKEVEEFSERWQGVGSIGIYPSNASFGMVKLRLRYPADNEDVRADFDAMVKDMQCRLGVEA
ncbi:hypothetical protein SARC_01445 [Sphaeroforma arctica JP610]|uniref:MoaB/Mog domain-containing protein n=1 Tax=Sphaeroforma arctica JP610 TaxID=667725 RepID=A0A0L0GBL6_9EUKA|nr:hypothetical protein SARC_01445 [Sphaeroforma arctica JP610]KNC86395.1 hypothetical protein SARC_01445 [Sphaeroforma arctica JP610]|eukprot:XP_014160297.1 hypothetical protein SARC_01445 [Sphaeroforma arctica JP610]